MTLSSTAVERAIAQCTSRWAMARGHRLNTSIVLAAVHGLSGLFRAVSAVEPITLALFPTLSPSLIGHPASVDVKQHKSCLFRAQELCESRGGRPGLLVPNSLYGLCGRKPTLDLNTTFSPQSSGAVSKSRWPSWVPVPNKLDGLTGRKATLKLSNTKHLGWFRF